MTHSNQLSTHTLVELFRGRPSNPTLPITIWYECRTCGTCYKMQIHRPAGWRTWYQRKSGYLVYQQWDIIEQPCGDVMQIEGDFS